MKTIEFTMEDFDALASEGRRIQGLREKMWGRSLGFAIGGGIDVVFWALLKVTTAYLNKATS